MVEAFVERVEFHAGSPSTSLRAGFPARKVRGPRDDVFF